MVFQENQVQEIKETAPLILTVVLPQKFTPKTQEVKINQLKKQQQTRRVSQTMGRQRNTSQIKGKKESSEGRLNKTEASQQ